MSQWKGKLAGLVAAGLLAVLPLSAVPAFAEPPAVPEDIYQWVQSTARQNYYFNKQQMCYEIRADGTVDEHVLIVPTLRTYDDVQLQDVISKRRWKLEDLTGYDIVIHCGSCMFNRSYVLCRVAEARAAGVPMTNYGLAIAALLGILPDVALPETAEA